MQRTTILDEPADLELLATFGDRTDFGHASVLEVADGTIVAESPSGIRLRGTALGTMTVIRWFNPRLIERSARRERGQA